MFINTEEVQDKGTPVDINNIYYSRQALMGYNAMINFILSVRGPGKTFDFKRMALDSKCETVWMRRLGEDIKPFLASPKPFMDDLWAAGMYENDDFYVKDRILWMNDEPKVTFMDLASTPRYKSNPFPKVNYIVFDEFIEVKRNRSYLKGDVDLFLDFVETVNRLRLDGRPEVRCFFLGNKVSFVNPYFQFWNIRDFEGRFKTYQDGLVCVEKYENQEYNRLKKASRFGQLTAGTRYGKFLTEDEVWRDEKAFLKPKPPEATLKFNVRIGDAKFGIWVSDCEVFCSIMYNRQQNFYAPRFEVKEGESILTVKTGPGLWLKSSYEACRLYFDDVFIKDMCLTFIQGGFEK